MTETVITVAEAIEFVEVSDDDATIEFVESVNEISEVIEVYEQGLDGADGTSGGLKYIHTQASASAEWIVNHNLGEKPLSEVRTTGGQTIEADILHVSINQLRVYFSQALAGEVRCL